MWGIFCSNTYFPAHRFSLSSLYVCFCFAYPCTLHEIYYIFHILLSIQFYFFGILYIFIFAFLYIFMFTVILPILKYFWQKISEIIVTRGRQRRRRQRKVQRYPPADARPFPARPRRVHHQSLRGRYGHRTGHASAGKISVTLTSSVPWTD